MAHKVLIVDDVSMFVELEKSFLQRTAVNALVARNGREALTLCQAERPSLVFMDLHMPVMSGADSCKAIKEDPQLKSTKVVLITSEGKEADRLVCMEAGCDDFLTKPLDRTLFLDTARRLIPGIDRRDRRISCRIKLKFRIFGVTLSGVASDISCNGLYLATDFEAEKNAELDIILALPGQDGGIIQGRARVAWVNGSKSRRKPSFPEGFGVELTYLSDDAAAQLRRFVEGTTPFI